MKPTLEQRCRKLVKEWSNSAEILDGAFDSKGFARVIKQQAIDLESILPKKRTKKGKR